MELARVQARASFEKDFAYRLWCLKYGGVYVPVSEDTQPNPHLSGVPERDITTPSGRSLTLVNPAYMIRKVSEMAEESGTLAHIASLSPTRPENAADDWEKAALKEMQGGKQEICFISQMRDGEYMRFMRPLVSDESCLGCHDEQQYRRGDIRGGISVSVPMEPFRVSERAGALGLLTAHALLWLLGLAGIFYGRYLIRQGKTERKRAEEILEESERRYRAIVEDQTELVSRFLPDGTLTFVNQAYCRFFNESSESLIGRRFWRHLPEEDRERFRSYLASFGPESPVSCIEHQVFASGGEIRWQQWIDRAFFDDSGRVVEFQAVGRDVTDRKKAERVLAEEAIRRRILFEQSKDGIVVLDETGKVYEANQRYADMLGYSLEEVSDLHVWDWDAKWTREQLESQLHLIDSAGATFETRHRRKDGTIFDVEISTNGAVLAGRKLVFCVCRDISQRKQAEEAIEKRIVALTRPLDAADSIEFNDLFNYEEIQKLQDQFAKACGVASIITHPDGAPITKPSMFCRLCEGIIRQTEIGLKNCYHSDSVIGCHSPDGPIVQQCLSGGLWDAGASITVGDRHIANWLIGQVRNEAQNEARMRAYAREIGADEETFMEAFQEVPSMSKDQFEKIAQALFTLAGQLSSMAYQNIQQARFITERKRAEEEKEKLEAQLFHAQKLESVGRLAGGVAHDFNNMLGVIMGRAEMALNQIDIGAPLYREIEEILKAANRSAELTRQLLAFARRQTASPKVLDLNETISGMLKMLRRLIGEDISLVWMPGHELWRVKVDPSQIDQILANLTVNARDAISGIGSITLRTENAAVDEYSCSQQPGFVPGEYVLLTVSDTGAGMNEEVLSQIFEPFFTTKEIGRGTGLGLATVYGIVKQNNGFIYAESKPEMGATIRIYLPRFEAETEHAKTEIKPLELKGGRETILLVEDDESVLTLSKKMLESLRYSVLAVQSPTEAIHIAESYPGDIHLLLSDVVMPEMNGRELAERIQTIRKGIKCLYMSGYTADMIAHRGILETGVHFIHKPFRRNDLAAKIRELLELNQAKE
jgi:PAS domain S-box-containing protein